MTMTLEPPKKVVSKRAPKKVLRWVIWGPVAGFVVLIIAGGAWRHYHPGQPLSMVPIETVTVTRSTIEKSVESAGTVVSNLDVDIKCRAGGPVAKLPVDVSQKVKAGDLLCQLDPTDEQLAVRVAERTVAQSTAKLEQAKLAYQTAELNLQTTREKEEAALVAANVKAANLQSKADRQAQLKEQKLGSEEDFETAQTDAAGAKNDASAAQVAVNELKQQELQLQNKKFDVATAEAVLESDKFNLDTEKQQLEYTTVLSPMDGTVSVLDVQIGSMVQSGIGGFSGGTTVMSLSDLSRMFVTATVDQSDIGGILLDQPVRVEVDSFPGRSFTGKVVRIGTTGNNVSNVVTFNVKIEVTDKDKSLLRPAMTGTATIVEGERKNVLVVPTAAVNHKGSERFVTLAGGKEQKVTLGMEGEDQVEVVSGLNEGDKVTYSQVELPTRWKSTDGGPPK